MDKSPTVHASCVLVGARAALIRGASGSGKSALALRLLQSGMPFTRLVGDDRIHLEAENGVLLARPAAELAGLIEVRGLGIERRPFEPVAVVGLVIDLGTGERLPVPAQLQATLEGIRLARVAIPPEIDPFRAVLAFLERTPSPI